VTGVPEKKLEHAEKARFCEYVNVLDSHNGRLHRKQQKSQHKTEAESGGCKETTMQAAISNTMEKMPKDRSVRTGSTDTRTGYD